MTEKKYRCWSLFQDLQYTQIHAYGKLWNRCFSNTYLRFSPLFVPQETCVLNQHDLYGVTYMYSCLMQLLFHFLGSEHMTRGNQGGQISCFSERSDIMCSLAHSTLFNIVEELFNGTLTIAELKDLYQKRDQVNKLSNASPELKSRQVKAALEQKHRELEAFNAYKSGLTPLCRDLISGNLKVQG